MVKRVKFNRDAFGCDSLAHGVTGADTQRKIAAMIEREAPCGRVEAFDGTRSRHQDFVRISAGAAYRQSHDVLSGIGHIGFANGWPGAWDNPLPVPVGCDSRQPIT